MSNDFTPPDQVLSRVSEEIALLRRDLQIAMISLSRIEKRLVASFPNYPSKKVSTQSAGAPRPVSEKSRDQLLQLFDTLVQETKAGGEAGFEMAVGRLKDEDALALAFELGVAGKKKVGTTKAKEGIRKRIQESILLRFNRRVSVDESEKEPRLGDVAAGKGVIRPERKE
jgi:hypothetical protein